MEWFIEEAIKQARKDGHKGVRAFVGGIDEHNEYSKLLAEGKLISYNQEYAYDDRKMSCILMRKP